MDYPYPFEKGFNHTQQLTEEPLVPEPGLAIKFEQQEVFFPQDGNTNSRPPIKAKQWTAAQRLEVEYIINHPNIYCEIRTLLSSSPGEDILETWAWSKIRGIDDENYSTYNQLMNKVTEIREKEFATMALLREEARRAKARRVFGFLVDIVKMPTLNQYLYGCKLYASREEILLILERVDTDEIIHMMPWSSLEAREISPIIKERQNAALSRLIGRIRDALWTKQYNEQMAAAQFAQMNSSI